MSGHVGSCLWVAAVPSCRVDQKPFRPRCWQATRAMAVSAAAPPPRRPGLSRTGPPIPAAGPGSSRDLVSRPPTAAREPRSLQFTRVHSAMGTGGGRAGEQRRSQWRMWGSRAGAGRARATAGSTRHVGAPVSRRGPPVPSPSCAIRSYPAFDANAQRGRAPEYGLLHRRQLPDPARWVASGPSPRWLKWRCRWWADTGSHKQALSSWLLPPATHASM